jgi:hypothetical protein
MIYMVGRKYRRRVARRVTAFGVMREFDSGGGWYGLRCETQEFDGGKEDFDAHFDLILEMAYSSFLIRVLSNINSAKSKGRVIKVH